MSAAIEQRNKEATCYVGNLEDRVSEELLWELMLQAGPVVNVHMPKDKVASKHLGYGFVEYRTEEDADYAVKIMNMIKMYGKPIKVNKASQNKRFIDVGANLFIGNLDPDVDEKLLYDTFSAFGGISQTPKIVRDPDSQMSRGFGFVSYENFEASDLAIECMNGQYLCNRGIQVQYAYKKDTPGERHGTHAERMLAASTPGQQTLKPHTNFATGQDEGGMHAQNGGGDNRGGSPQPQYMPPPVAYGNQHMMDPNMMYQMQMQQIHPGMHPGAPHVFAPPPHHPAMGYPPPMPPMPQGHHAPMPPPPPPLMQQPQMGFVPPPPPPPPFS
jgi:splicing factor 3B subunit 4